MNTIEERTEYYYRQYRELEKGNAVKLPGRTCILEDGSVMSFPREDGDDRYQYGEGGFNLWTYTSGNIHANRGLFSLFLRGGEGKEQNAAFHFGCRRNGGYRVVPITAALDPEGGNGDTEYFCVFTDTETFYYAISDGILGVLHVYAAQDDSMAFTTVVRNISKERREISLCSYLNPFLREGLAPSDEDKWFRTCEHISDVNGEDGFFFRINVDVSRTLSVVNYGAVDNEVTFSDSSVKLTGSAVTTSRLDYIGGMMGSLYSPSALRRGSFDSGREVTSFNDTAIAGKMIFAVLPAGESVTLHQTLAFRRNETVSLKYGDVRKKAETGSFCAELEAGYERAAAFRRKLSMRFEGNDDADKLTAFIPHLIKQVDFCASISGYVQLSTMSLVGIRDVFQAIEGSLYSEPEKARAKMLEALSFIGPDGRAPRQYALPAVPGGTPPMDLRPFIDQGVWIIDTVMTYLRVTGDFSILEQKCGYTEIVDEERRITRKSSISDSVLDHLFRIMAYLLSNIDKKTHCLHAVYGDWNDALDGLGVRADGKPGYGSGVSVMASLQFYRNLGEMTELLEMLGQKGKCKYDDRITVYKEIRGLLREGLIKNAVVKNEKGDRRIIHGWGDNRAYLVGSFCDSDRAGRVGVTSNAFWVLSGLYDEDRSYRSAILGAFDALDSTYGFKTFEPGFKRNAVGFGRICKLPLGTAENGAVYVHASAFAVRALFGMGEPEYAWRQLYKLLPIFHDRVSVSPYVCPNSYGENASIGVDGESMNDWQTGSSNVILKSLIADVFGFRPTFDGLLIRPAAGSPFNEMALEVMYRGHRVRISIYGNCTGGKRRFTVNGTEKNCTDEDGGLLLGEMELKDIFSGECDGMSEDTVLNIEVYE